MAYEQYRPSGFRMLPPVVKNIMIISGIFFLATYSLGAAFNINLKDILGMHYFASEKFRIWQVVTYMFMHEDFSHIFFNLFAFWMFGYLLENVWGSKRFLLFFIVTGVGAALIQMLVFYIELRPILEAIDHYQKTPDISSLNEFLQSKYYADINEGFRINFANKYNHILAHSDSLQQLANISVTQAHDLQQQALQMPAIADSLKEQSTLLIQNADLYRATSDSLKNVNIANAVDFYDQYRNDLMNAPLVIGASGAVFGVLLAFGMLFPNTRIYLYFLIPIKAKWFVIIYGAIELIAGFGNFAGDNVAHFAHLGGMLFGFILIKIWNKRNRKTLF
jgi:membrane associated rhomboid family serine protease